MTIRKKNQYSYFWVYGIIGFISTFICLAFNKLVGYEFLFLIPLTYSIVSLLFYFSLIKKSNEEVFGFVFILFNFAIFLKYAITPLSMIIQEYYSCYQKVKQLYNHINNILFKDFGYKNIIDN